MVVHLFSPVLTIERLRTMIIIQMKRAQLLTIIICSLLVLLVVLTSCGDKVKTYVDTGEVINTSVNDEFIIALDYDLIHLWRETYDESMLGLLENMFDASPKVKRGEEEHGIAQYFRFKALKEGKTEITINKMTVDGQRIIVQKVFNVNIE